MITFDDCDGVVFHAEADIIVAKGHAIDALRIVMIRGTRIKSECLA